MMSLISGYRSIVYEYQRITYLFPRVPIRAPTACFENAEDVRDEGEEMRRFLIYFGSCYS